jgi:uncharacterized protein YciI
MLFVVYCLDHSLTGKSIRARTRAAHLQYVADHRAMFRYGGALLSEGGDMIGTLALIEANDRPSLDEFLRNDPYNVAQLFETVIITPTKQMLPEVTAGFLAAELDKVKGMAAA